MKATDGVKQGRLGLGEEIEYTREERVYFEWMRGDFHRRVVPKLRERLEMAGLGGITGGIEPKRVEEGTALRGEILELYWAWRTELDPAMVKRLNYLADIFTGKPELYLCGVRTKYVSAFSVAASVKAFEVRLGAEAFGGTWDGLIEWLKARCRYVKHKVEDAAELGIECTEYELKPERMGGFEVWDAVGYRYQIFWHKRERRWISFEEVECFERESVSLAVAKAKIEQLEQAGRLEQSEQSGQVKHEKLRYIPANRRLYDEEMLLEFHRLEMRLLEAGEAELEIEGKQYVAKSKRQLAVMFLRRHGMDEMKEESFLAVYRGYVPKVEMRRRGSAKKDL